MDEKIEDVSPVAIPVSDVSVTYDSASVTLTLPGYLDRKQIERSLRYLCKKRTPYDYRCHTWRNAAVDPVQRKL